MNDVTADSTVAGNTKNATVDESVRALLAAIQTGSADGIFDACGRLEELQGSNAVATIAAAIGGDERAEATLALLKERAESLQTSGAWSRLAGIALVLGDDALAAEAADASMKIEPGIDAGFIAIVILNRRGEYQAAEEAIAQLTDRFPTLQNDPHMIQQSALAELRLGRPESVLATLERNREGQSVAGLDFDAGVLRARAFEMISDRSAEVVPAWEYAVSVANEPAKIDAARNGLIGALLKSERFDETLRQIDTVIETTIDPDTRSTWLELRPNILAANGDIDEALSTLEEMFESASGDRTRRRELRLRQAHIAVGAARWKEAASAYDAAVAEIAPEEDPAHELRHAVQFEKANTLAMHDIDSVLADLDELDAAWNNSGWPQMIDMRVNGLLAADRADDALAWLTERTASSSSLANHPATFQLRGEVEIRRGNIDEGMRWFARAAALTPDGTDERALGAIMMSAYGTQQWKTIVAAYRRLVELDPVQENNPNLRVIAAAAHLRLGERELALGLTEDVQPIGLLMRATRDQVRSEALVHLKKYDDALATTKAALELLLSAGPGDVLAEFTPVLHTLRAQVFNAREEFDEAQTAAGAAIDASRQSAGTFAGLSAIIRTSAFVQRSVALFKLGKLKEAQADTDAALTELEQSRTTTIVRMISGAVEFDDMESTLWYIKGRLLDEEKRNEESLAAYTRAAQFEKTGNKAMVACGHALISTGAYAEALTAFEDSLTRAITSADRADALTGKGRSLVLLARFEEAIDALQAALDARLMEPDNDPGVFELLGIAYNALKRTGAAERAFRRAWKLKGVDERNANLARGITAAQLSLGRPDEAVKFLNEIPEALKKDRTLLFNRALALDAVGDRRAAIGCLIRAKNAGLDKAQNELDRLDTPAGLARWTHYWFGAMAGPWRRMWGVLLLSVAATGLAAPVFQWWLNGKLDWYLLLLPSVVALVGLALPNLKSFAVEAGGVKLSAEPMTATGRDVAISMPEGFNVPILGAMSIDVTGLGATSLAQSVS